MASRVERGRSAFAKGAWGEAFALLANPEGLGQADLELLAVAAHLVGDVRASELAWERAHRIAAGRGDAESAARCAFWLGFDLLLRGEGARASGWLARAERAIGDDRGSAAGLLLLPQFLMSLDAGDAHAAHDLARQMTAIGRATGDPDLLGFGLLGEGEALLALGDVAAGMRRLDEVMVSITTGEVSPIPTGVIYCAVIDACMHARDLRRAAEWTEALSAWCSADPALVPYRGQCLVHRSQVLMARGAWREASEEAERARAHLAAPEHPALGDALYQQGELLRLQGRLDEAEEAYRAASGRGRDPIPGFALLRLAQGRADAATASAQRMLRETQHHPDRPPILAAAIEIFVATGALAEATLACTELEERATAAGTEVLDAMASMGRAALLLATGDAADALDHARRAITLWRGLEMPFELARARALMAGVCHALGDLDAADLERHAACSTFAELGASAALGALAATPEVSALTGREREVIRLVAAGHTNREIAAELVISEHTVARHLQNIFVKVGVSSRAGATAYAYEHGIV